MNLISGNSVSFNSHGSEICVTRDDSSIITYIEERIAFLKEENRNPRVNHYAVIDELQTVLDKIKEANK